MQLSAKQIVNALPEQVFAALNNPDVLQRCIPGCEAIESRNTNELILTVTLKIGPVNTSFKGNIYLSNLNPPHHYTITGQAEGLAGFAKGSADVKLLAVEDKTKLCYDVKVEISGKIAQLGTRLIEGTAKKLAKKFFENLANVISNTDESETELSLEQQKKQREKKNNRLAIILLGIGVIMAMITVLLTGSR